MKVTQEVVTVLADRATGEINIVLAGWRLVLTADEASLLVSGLLAGLDRLRAEKPEAPTVPEAWTVGRSAAAAAEPAAESMQQRTRALIQATIRDKGLSL